MRRYTDKHMNGIPVDRKRGFLAALPGTF